MEMPAPRRSSFFSAAYSVPYFRGNYKYNRQKFRFDGKGAKLKTERTENTAVSDCCFGMQDHLYGFELLLKPASEGENSLSAQTVSPSDTNAKAQSRKMVSIPSKAAGHSGCFLSCFLSLCTRTPQSSMSVVGEELQYTRRFV